MNTRGSDDKRLATPASRPDVVILGGGLGTRLAHVLPGRPKIFAPVAGRPILDLHFDRLRRQGFSRVILALGHLADQVIDHIQDGVDGMEIVVSVEPKPLGTAGAIAHALSQTKSTPIVVMNGDSLIDANIAAFVDWAEAKATNSALIATKVPDAHRYGVLRLAGNGLVESFDEKPEDNGQAWINAGVYWLDATALELIAAISRGSLECNILAKLPPGQLTAYCLHERFIDIGTPESLIRADRWPIGTAERLGDQCA